MKRTLALILALMLVLAGVAAFAEEPVTLTFAFWGNTDEIEVREHLAEMYMETHPNVKIECTYTDGANYPTKLQTWFASDETPDIFGIANDILRPYMDIGVIADLKPYVEADGLNDSWNPVMQNILSNAEGYLYAVPFGYKIAAIAYNKDLFDAAGVAYPEAGWTEEELVEKALALTNHEGRIPQYGLYASGWLLNLLRNLYGNPIYDVDSKTMTAEGNDSFKHALELFNQMIAVDKSSPDAVTAESYGGGFESGMYGMAIVAPWDVGAFETTIGDNFKWDLVELPTSEAYGHWKGNLYSDGWCMSATTEYPDEAWDFIKFLTTSYEAQSIAGNFEVPSLTSYATSEEYLTADYNKNVFVDMVDNAVAWETTGVWARINDVLETQYTLLFNGDIDIDTAISAIQSEGTALLAE